MATREKCLLVASIFPPIRGGSAVVYVNLARFGHGRIIMLAPYRHYQTGHAMVGWKDYDKSLPFTVYRVELLRPRQTTPLSRLHSLWMYATVDLPLKCRILIKITGIVIRERIGIVCIGELDSGGWVGLFAKWFLRCKVINYIHGEEITTSAKYMFFGRGKRRYLARADAIVAVSNFTKQAITQNMNIDPVKVEVILNGVDRRRFRPQPSRPDLVRRYALEGCKVLLTVGRLIERKGIDRTIEALPAVIARCPDVRLLIVGEGPYRPTLEQIAKDVGVQPYVTFVGTVDDEELPDYYALCDVFIMPNRQLPNGDTEGFGLVFLEANACGKPVIGGRAGGAVEAVRDGSSGLLVDGSRTSDVSAAIIRLLEDQGLYERLGRGGQNVAEHSDWAARAEEFLAVCQRLVRNGTTR